MLWKVYSNFIVLRISGISGDGHVFNETQRWKNEILSIGLNKKNLDYHQIKVEQNGQGLSQPCLTFEPFLSGTIEMT